MANENKKNKDLNQCSIIVSSKLNTRQTIGFRCVDKSKTHKQAVNTKQI